MPVPVPAQSPLLAKVKRLILRKGGDNGIRALSRAFRVMDDDGDQTLSPDELRNGLAEYGIQLSDAEIARLVTMFDRDRDGRIGITEFLTALRGGISAKRRAYVQRAFQIFDQNGDGRLTLDEIRARFRAAGHPLVVQGERSEEEVLNDFVASFDDATNPDGIISKQEFEQYYAGVSAGIDSDEYFIALLKQTWDLGDSFGKSATKLDRTTGQETARSPAASFTGLDSTLRTIKPTTYTLQEKEQAVGRHLLGDRARHAIKKVEKTCLERVPTRFRGLGREFRKSDPKRTGYVESEEVDEVLRRAKLHFHLTPDEVEALKTEFDTDRDGTVDYLALMGAVCGELEPQRKILLERTWKRFRRTPKGLVSIQHLHDNYVADYTPEVAKGLKSRGQVLSAFLDAWDVRHCPSGKVSYDEFEEYYNAISREIPNSRHFDTMIKVSWKVWQDEGQRLLDALLQ
eukprot:TRINITY_DN71446_c0_g1_i1.p1 TRINITY_DN71446_c0_g1~~TRINITY_DN71446_c0_g1_i1.p1  ORF type:complete len:458 (+),score=147.89 TRINITY_DN71446_c0_g1_i1:103-1476(+)